ncbi:MULTISPECIES: CASTOR/POLLUX-related putative ion channel [Streptosporangium]|uniref:Trk K+ transport system NAD-binding subunit n=1 Tax=Streptosporangium brasiliense TaxID=47480 RepID=A0ABT9R7A9_9ACTN|nr:TrkA C-terminal domain-containing protein [Streptosporangium brasiliense]MDP9864757.1 Trk K+ transport system NAD-binding subunit [Streptosporangium brasiliense]
MSRATFRERVRYWFDNTMSRGAVALIGWLALISLGLILLVTLLSLWLTPVEAAKNNGFAGMLWMSLMRTLSPGKVASDTGSTLFVALMFTASLGGIFIVSALVGVLSNGLKTKFEQLRKGKSRIIETRHTVILGWSDQVFTIVDELVQAHASQRGSVISILADKDKVDMEDEIRQHVGETGRTKLVCRTGRPTEPTDLDLMNLDAARSVVVLSPQGDDPDAHVIKTLLALAKRSGDHPPVVAAIASTSNMAAARLAGGPAVHLVDSDDTASRLIVQSSRQSGTSVVCMDLLNFSGGEIYLRSDRDLAGMTYGDALPAYQTATVIGLRREGRTMLNPPMDTVIAADDQIIVIAQDDSMIHLADDMPQAQEESIVSAEPDRPGPERTLVLNWNGRGHQIIRCLDGYVAPGSVLDIASDHPDASAGFEGLVNLTVNAKDCDTTDRYALEALGLGVYQHVVVLSDDRYEPAHADTRTLMTLLQLRDMQTTLGERYSIVSEMHDENNRALAEVTRADDIVISDTVIGLLLAQLTENQHLVDVFGYLFDSRGSEIYPRPAGQYVRAGAPVSFASVIESARRRGETAIGYRLADRVNEAPHFGVVLNPDKSRPLRLGPGDSVIVLAER